MTTPKSKRKVCADKPCWCYTGEFSTCADCDREFILIDIRTWRKVDHRVRAMIDEIREAEMQKRLPADELERRM